MTNFSFRELSWLISSRPPPMPTYHFIYYRAKTEHCVSGAASPASCTIVILLAYFKFHLQLYVFRHQNPLIPPCSADFESFSRCITVCLLIHPIKPHVLMLSYIKEGYQRQFGGFSEHFETLKHF